MKKSLAEILDLALWLLELVAAYTPTTADEKIGSEIRKAISSLRAVRGSKVLKTQIDAGMLKKRWKD